MKDIITKYTAQIAKAEGFDVTIKFLKLHCSGKEVTYGNCYKEKKRINFSILFSLSPHIIKKVYPKPDIWEIMLHEICHLKNRENSKYSFIDLKKNEYIDWQHNLNFWKDLRGMRKKYSRLKKQFNRDLQELQNSYTLIFSTVDEPI